MPEMAVSQKKISPAIEETQKKAQKLGIQFVDLTGRQIPNDVLREISEEAAIFYQIVPFAKEGNVLKVGLLNPDDLKAQEALRFIALRAGLVPEIYALTQSDYENILKQYRNLKVEVWKALTEFSKELEEEKKREKVKKIAEKREEAKLVEAPISKIVAVILQYAQEGRA